LYTIVSLCYDFTEPSFVPVHWYDTTPENFQAYVQNFHAQTGLDIWITEYACQNFNGGSQCSNAESEYYRQLC
jgi:hypothetical protein